MIYFVAADNQAIKIGWSKRGAIRLGELQVGSYSNLRLLGTMEGKPSYEAKLHKRFKRLRIRGEWFQYHKEILAYVKAYCRPAPAPSKEPSPNQTRELRKRLDLSQVELADRLGVDQATVSRIEAGKQRPSKPVLKLLEVIANGS